MTQRQRLHTPHRHGREGGHLQLDLFSVLYRAGEGQLGGPAYCATVFGTKRTRKPPIAWWLTSFAPAQPFGGSSPFHQREN